MDYSDRIRLLKEGATPDGVDSFSASVEWGNGSACEVESGEFYFGFCRRNKFKLVLTTGSHRGFDVGFIASALYENGVHYPHMKGHVITMDVGDYGARQMWDRLELDNITQIIGDSRVQETWNSAGIRRPVDWGHL